MPATINKPPPQDEASNDHERLIAIEEFVTHGFGDMVKGAVGVLATEKAPKGAGKKH